jgi:ribosomal protein S18 acetylase RimI-like enzyme
MMQLDLQKLELGTLSGDQQADAFRLIVQLRDHLDRDEYLRRLRVQQAAGYQLVGAWLGGAMVGVMGMRAVHTLARGAHLHIDDLVVDAAARRAGVGSALLKYALGHAREQGLVSIFLDSRPEVIEFYRTHGFAEHSATLMRIRVAR